MATTITKSTREEVETAFAEFKTAQDAFAQAAEKFQSVFDPNNVSLAGLDKDIDETFSEIMDAIEEAFEDED